MKKIFTSISLLLFLFSYNFSQTWEATVEIENSDPLSSFFGQSIAVYGDYAVAGQPNYSPGGRAVVYFMNGITWEEVAVLTPSDATSGDAFGTSVAFDNDVIAVGSPGDDDGVTSSGSVYVFEMPGGGWLGNLTETAKLTQATAKYALLGTSVAMDGDVIVSGAPGLKADPVFTNNGGVFVFKKPGSNWSTMTQTALLIHSSPTTSAKMGTAVDIDNDIIVSGSPGYSSSKGRAFIFKRSGSNWSNMTAETAILSAQYGSISDKLGTSVCVDSNLIVIGAPNRNSMAGSIYIYEKSGTSWTTAYETNSDQGLTNEYYGGNVKILHNVIYASARGYDSKGAIYMINQPAGGWSTSIWSSDQEIITHDSANASDNFGSAFDVNNENLVVGVPYHDGATLDNGSIFFLRPPAVAPTQQAYNIITTIKGTSTDIDWIDGNGDRRIVLMKQATTLFSPNAVDIINSPTFEANDTFGLGTELMYGSPSGWYCVFNGDTHDNLVVKGLNPNTKYNIKVLEYNGIQGQEKYRTVDSTNNPVNIQTGIDLTGVTLSVKDNILYGTTTAMQYSRSGATGFFQPCTATNTTVSMGFIDREVWVREAANWDNMYLVKDIKRLAQPALTIDFINERINETIDTDIEYSYQSNFSTSLFGTNNVLSLASGENIYFRYPSTVDSLQSLTLTMSGPERDSVSYTIDYASGSTNEEVGDTVEYAEDAAFSVNVQHGTNAALTLTPGSDIWFRVYASNANQKYQGKTFALTVPAAPAAPTNPVVDNATKTFDWTNNPSFTSVSDYEYSIDSGSTWTVCTQKPIDIGNVSLEIAEVRVRIKASNTGTTRFASTALESDAAFVYSVPSAPNFTINYLTKSTNEVIPDTVEYNNDNNFSTANTLGSGSSLLLSPGNDVYFRIIANGNHPAGDVQHLVVPAIPSTPVVPIDYINMTTLYPLGDTMEYYTGIYWQACSGTKIDFSASIKYVRLAASNTNHNFASNMVTLKVTRPDAPTAPAVDDANNQFNWTNNSSYTSASDYEYSIDSGATWTTCASKPVDIGNVDLPAGKVQVRVRASNTGDTRFTGNALLSDVDFTKTVVGTNTLSEGKIAINVYPNPTADILYITGVNASAEILVTDALGKTCMTVSGSSSIDLGSLPRGMYFIKITNENGTIIERIIKE